MTWRDGGFDDQDKGFQEAGQSSATPVDFAFLDSQTDGDRALQDDVLALFLSQARRLIPTLPRLSCEAQGDVAHLLKGSARGIGAWAIADATEAYEAADPALRPALFQRLAAAFEWAEAAIQARLTAAAEAGAPPKATI